MTNSEKVFFDTAPFIYLVENHPKYYLPVANFMADHLTERDDTFLTSVLSIAEFGVRPKKVKNKEILLEFENALKDLNFQILEITYTVADLSSSLRAQYDFLRGIDSLQLASAITENCKKFFTNDKQLKLVKEIEVILVDDLIPN